MMIDDMPIDPYKLSFYLLAFSRHVIPGTIDRRCLLPPANGGACKVTFPVSISVEAVIVCICYN